MTRRIDLTGQRFGRLTVLGRVLGGAGGARWHWRCLCDCGGSKNVKTSSLLRGGTKSCGCLSKESRRVTGRYRRHIVLAVGQRYGRLTVLGPRQNNPLGHMMWRCRCDCDPRKEVVVKGSSMVSGKTRSCGCLRLDSMRSIGRNRVANLIVGQRYGHLTVVKRIDGRRGDRSSFWLCKCVCDNECIKRGGALRCGYTVSCGLCLRNDTCACGRPMLRHAALCSRCSQLARRRSDVSERYREQCRRSNKAGKDMMRDWYIRALIVAHSRATLRAKDIPRVMVDAKREHVRVLRFLRRGAHEKHG